MELIELQNMWAKHSKDISENKQINKQILKVILTSKTEKRINWIKAKAIFKLLLPLVLVATILIPRINVRGDVSFIIGSLLFGIIFITDYYWSIQYFLKVSRIDLEKSITKTKIDIIELEKYKFRITKLSYMLIPFALIGLFLMMDLPIFSMNSLVPISLIILVMMVSIYVTFKFSIIEQFKNINREIAEVERLEVK